jgi:hypothetical protein
MGVRFVFRIVFTTLLTVSPVKVVYLWEQNRTTATEKKFFLFNELRGKHGRGARFWQSP